MLRLSISGVLGAFLVCASAHAAPTGVRISEWMYNGLGVTGEFIEPRR
jgi:hypothetical protein